MSDKKVNILKIISIVLVVVIVSVISLVIYKDKDKDTNINDSSFSDKKFSYDFVYEYVSSLYETTNNKISVEEDEDYYIATVKDTNDELVIRLLFDKKDKSITKDSSDLQVAGGAYYDPSLEDNNE